jgi:hypothetical protein
MVKNVALVLAGLVAGVTIMVAGLWPGTEVLYRNTQPDTVAYEDKSSHHLGLIRKDSLFGGPQHLIVVGRDPGFGYGHMLGSPGEEVTDTTWTAEGVRVRFAGGHELFVPARWFMNGR